MQNTRENCWKTEERIRDPQNTPPNRGEGDKEKRRSNTPAAFVRGRTGGGDRTRQKDHTRVKGEGRVTA